MLNELQQKLADMTPTTPFFVGVDSDGCVFDSMELKHRRCFCPNTLRHWRLQAVAAAAEETLLFVNLYSKWRGANRWPALVQAFDLLRERPEVAASGVAIPTLTDVRAFVDSGLPLSNEGLRRFMQERDSAELRLALAWSEDVNRSVAEVVVGLPPFPQARTALERLRGRADAVVVSTTPTATLAREWAEHDLTQHVRMIAGQEAGAKKQSLQLAAGPRNYLRDHVLMIGDAPGDLAAAESCGGLFFPIEPAREDECWRELAGEGLDRFFSGAFAGAYQRRLVDDFRSLLPEHPPWSAKDAQAGK